MRKGFAALVIGGMLVIAAATKASAQCCIGFVESCTCGPAVLEPPLPGEKYVVNQGPVYNGPGLVLRQPRDFSPPYYPYAGYVYSGYPVGIDGGGYPRGFYSPYTGYPFAEPPPFYRYHYRATRRHVRRHW
jgi:hypothetical protein